MSATRDYYDVLGVPRDADETTIKKAFRRLARELHPDVNSHDPDAEEKFKEAAEAYEVLSDTERRATYDRFGHEGLRTGGYAPNFEGFGSVADLFDAFFGGAGGFGDLFGGGARPGGAVQGGDVAVVSEIDLEQAAHGASVEVSYEAVALCEHCRGNGAEPGTPIETCPRCEGTGQLRAISRTPFGQVVRAAACDVCHGEGRVARDPCKVCRGRGRTVERPKVSVDVPAGIADGQRIRIAGRGHAGERGRPLRRPVRARAGARGPPLRPRRRRSRHRGRRLGAAGRTGHEGRGPDRRRDRRSSRSRPARSRTTALTVRGAGMPALRGRRHGDLRVVVNVVVPRHLDRDQRELFERLAGTLTDHNLRSDEGVFSKLRRAFGG